MHKKIILICLLVTCCYFGHAENSIRIIPDSTNTFAQVEISRNKPTTFKLSFEDEKGTVVYKTIVDVDSIAKLVSINWKDLKPGFYYLKLKNKKEDIKLLFVKKDDALLAEKRID